MEFYHYSPSVTFVVLTGDQFVGRDDGPLEQQKKDSHVCRRNHTFPLILTPRTKILLNCSWSCGALMGINEPSIAFLLFFSVEYYLQDNTPFPILAFSSLAHA